MKKVRRYQLIWLFRRLKKKLTGKPIKFSNYVGREIIDLQEANDIIAQWIEEGKPFAAARLGGTELHTIWHADIPQSPENQQKVLVRLQNLSGFFPLDVRLMQKFVEMFKKDCGSIDLMAVWFNIMEDYVIDCYCGRCELTYLMALEPWYVERPWTRVLEGKKVVVIHPFAESIKKQYEKREVLFDNPLILPKLEALYTVQAVQTLVGERDERFQDWFEALDWMTAEVMKYDFDVAIIGCGAYGLPLAARIKQAGKQAVHLGGATQLLFGIKGKRWDDDENINKYYNEHWVRPMQSEKPKRADIVENGCYW